MFKIIYFIAIIFVFAAACNQNKKDTGGKNILPGNKNGTVAENSYTTDTFFQALPNMLMDLSASENMQQLLAQNWIMEDDKEALETASDDGNLEIPVRTFCMAPDFTFTKNCRNAIETGIWNFDAAKKTLLFKYKNGGSDLYKLRALVADEMKLTNIGIKSETVLKFLSDAKPYKNKTDDPFYIANNKWRIAPTSSETDAAIRQRLRDNLHFFILFYKDAVAHQAAKISFFGLPSCIKWYAGAINLQNKNELSEIWKECFYNDAQAMKAYDMMDAVLSKKYNWPKEKMSWVKKNLIVLEQIYQNL